MSKYVSLFVSSRKRGSGSLDSTGDSQAAPGWLPFKLFWCCYDE
jgi:hypothetical protein